MHHQIDHRPFQILSRRYLHTSFFSVCQIVDTLRDQLGHLSSELSIDRCLVPGMQGMTPRWPHRPLSHQGQLPGVMVMGFERLNVRRTSRVRGLSILLGLSL